MSRRTVLAVLALVAAVAAGAACASPADATWIHPDAGAAHDPAPDPGR